jgi:crotonobetainyl-CoA:carnitine CoA-transferase CaiB-like acyl-CoA transferase
MLGLKGIRVLSFNHFLMGPVGVQSLADCGADVIAVEPLEGAFQRKWGGVDSRQVDGQTMLLLTGNRNKRSLALNLKDPRAIEIIMKLLPTIDVITENFRPGVMDKLGLGYEALKARKPDIIYAAGSGFGQDGPYVNRPGQDLIIQAMSGLAAITGTREGGPRAVGVSAVDHHGALLYANGILTALFNRERTGEGCRVDVNLLSAALDLQQESLICFLNGNCEADVRQTGHVAGWYFSAPYGIYATADGSVALSLSPLELFYQILDVPADEQIPASRAFDQQAEVAELLARRLVLKPMAHWQPIFDQHKIWYSQVNDYRQVVDDPQVKHLQSFTTIPGATGAPITLINHPVRYNGAAPQVRMPPQLLGAQTADILREAGYGDDAIETMLADGVIGMQPAAPAASAATGIASDDKPTN